VILADAVDYAEQAALLLRRRRLRQHKAVTRLRDLQATLSPKQAAYVLSPSPRRRLLGSRQSGKSHSIAVDHILCGFESRCDSMYIAPTSKSARNAVWSKFHALNLEYELQIEMMEGLFRAIYPNRSTCDFEGAHDIARVHRLRGKTISGKLTGDESGFFPERIIRELAGPVATAMFLTGRQRIAFASSPALQRRGFFFELGSNAAWEQHKLTAEDNPVIKDVARALRDLREASGWTEVTPAYMREGLGLEVDDATYNVYELTEINMIDALPEGPWTTIMLFDFGKRDQSAIAVVGWREYDPALYALHVEGHSDLDIEDLCLLAKPLIQRWGPIGYYGDPGGGGAQHMDYMRRRHGIAVRAVAKGKHYKKPAIDALNADMRRGLYKVPRWSPLVPQMQALQWDPTALAKTPKEYIEHASLPNDLCDVGGVYAHVQARHYRAEEAPPPPPPVGSAEALDRQAEQALRDAIARANQHNAEQEELADETAALLGLED
jgi:hypothetical protein